MSALEFNVGNLQGFGHISFFTAADDAREEKVQKGKKMRRSYDSQRNILAGIVTCSLTAFRWSNHICRVRSVQAAESTCQD